MIAERTVRVMALAVAILWASVGMASPQAGRSAMRGMVMKVAPSQRSFVVSHDSVPGAMDAMMMSFDVPNPKDLDGVKAGMTVTFTLVMGQGSVYAEQVRIQRYQPSEQDPLTAQRLAQLKRLTDSASTVPPVGIGQPVGDFTLIDQARHPVTLSSLRGKVVAINFIYTSCVLPQFCFRIANHFDVLNRRFTARVGRDLVFLTVTFDPARDQPEQLAEYASQWHANPDTWHFLTGAVPDVQRVCNLFGVDFYPDEGLMNHSSHTAVLDRQGRLVANIEGNQYTATQLGDLVATVLEKE